MTIMDCELPSDWRRVSVEDIKAPEKGSIVSGPFGSNIGKKFFVDNGVPVIRGNNLSQGEKRYIDNGYVYITEEKAYELRNCKAKPGDIIFTAAGTLGQVGIIPSNCQYPYYIISNKQLRLRVNRECVNPAYIYYWFSSPEMRTYIANQNTGASIPLITLGTLRRLPINLPHIKTQNKIASILSAYDDLIENNTRRIRILEEMAQTIYREWFVHFRFPGHEGVRRVESELGEIPEGWEGKFSDYVDFLEGPGLRNWQYRENGIPFLNIRTLVSNDIDFSKIQFIAEEEVLKKYTHFLLKAFDHVVSSSGTIGRVVTIRSDHLPLMLNTSIIRMRSKNERVGRWQLKHFLLSDYFQSQIRAYAIGSAQLNYGPIHLKQMKIIAPSEKLGKEYENIVTPLEEMICVLANKNANLRQQRDLLLPRLVSGELEVS